MPTELKTDEGLLERLRAAARQELSKDDLRQQRLSFILGNLPEESTITRQQVERVLARIEGEAA